MQKTICFIFVVFSLFLLVGCAAEETRQTAVVKPKNDVSIVVPEEPENLTPKEEQMLEENPSRAEPLDKEYVSLKTKTFDVELGDWYFTPETMEVNFGDTVVLNLMSVEGVHGFGLSEFGVNQRVSPNKPVTITFVANKRGEFTFYCSVVCGSGHSKMKGKLVVK